MHRICEAMLGTFESQLCCDDHFLPLHTQIQGPELISASALFGNTKFQVYLTCVCDKQLATAHFGTHAHRQTTQPLASDKLGPVLSLRHYGSMHVTDPRPCR